VKGRFLRMFKGSPDYERLRDSLAIKGNSRYLDFSEKWIDANVLAREFGTDWKTMMAAEKKGYIEMEDGSGNMQVAFIIDQVKANPGEITIIAIGTCDNIATAAHIAPEIVPLVKRVIYMGGSFFQPGNTTPTAEFNWWMDPDAAKMAVRSPFKEQIIVGLDVCETMPFRKDRYDHLKAVTNNRLILNMLQRNFLNQLFIDDPTYTHYIWDVIAACIMIDPTLIQDEVTRYVDVNSQFGFSYGQAVAFDKNQPIGTQQARIILKVDGERLWKMVEDYLSKF
jgi:inosine-uridine nucleoside N-ribohydrolase